MANPAPTAASAGTLMPGTGDHDRLVAALADPSLHGPDCAGVALLETHISSVLLTGTYAYKIKKPVNLGFLDFSTLAARHHYCEQELRLNRRLAPELYLGVVAITGTPAAPVIGGDGPPVDYAVKMREFAQHDLASRMLERGELLPAHIDALAGKVAAFHAAIAGAAPPAGCGTPATIRSVALANLEHLRPCMATAAEHAVVDRLEAWTRQQHALLAPMFDARRAEGFVRECHGDLHLGNIAVIADAPVIFDCIEFNDAMRWIDVMSEIAFTVMDLQERGRADLACRFLNAWLEHTGDYAGVPVLRFYLVYRALVRAKIAQLRAGQLAAGAAPAALVRERNAYLQLAQAYAQPEAAALIVTHGVSGCGKTALSGVLLEQIGAVRIRTDVERKRSFGVPVLRHEAAADDGRLYSAEAGRQTYERVRRLAAAVAGAGYVTIVDGAFLQRAQRDAFRDLAARLRLPFVILAFSATLATLRQRIALRSRRGNDASDADLAVLEQQLRTREVLTADEASCAVAIDTEGALESMHSPHAWHAVLERMGHARPAPAADVAAPGR